MSVRLLSRELENILCIRLRLFVLPSFALPFPFAVTFVLIWSSILVLHHASSEPIFPFINLKLNLGTVIQPCIRIVSLNDILPSYINASLVISACSLTTILDLIIRCDETKPFISVKEFNCPCVYRFLINITLILLVCDLSAPNLGDFLSRSLTFIILLVQDE